MPFGTHDVRHAGILLRELLRCARGPFRIRPQLVQFLGGRQRGVERRVAGLLLGADLLPQRGGIGGQLVVICLRRRDGGSGLAAFLVQLVAARLGSRVLRATSADALGFQLADLLLGGFDLGVQFLDLAIVLRLELFVLLLRLVEAALRRPFGPSMTSFQFLCVAYTAIDSPMNTRLMIRMSTTKTLPSQFMVSIPCARPLLSTRSPPRRGPLNPDSNPARHDHRKARWATGISRGIHCPPSPDGTRFAAIWNAGNGWCVRR